MPKTYWLTRERFEDGALVMYKKKIEAYEITNFNRIFVDVEEDYDEMLQLHKEKIKNRNFLYKMIDAFLVKHGLKDIGVWHPYYTNWDEHIKFLQENCLLWKRAYEKKDTPPTYFRDVLDALDKKNE